MEQSHMSPDQGPPHAQPRLDSALRSTAMQPTGGAALTADASDKKQTSSDHQGHGHHPSSDFSAPINTPVPALSFQNDPTTELAPIQPLHEKSAGSSAQTLPSLSSLTPLSSLIGAQTHTALPEPSHPSPHSKQTNWPSSNPFTACYTPAYLDPVEPSPSISHRGTSVSLDDPDVRIAAEALGQMRTDCGSSPRNRRIPRASTSGHRKMSRDRKPARPSPHPEPLLSIITTSHPLLATTIEGATSAYNSGKNYSPHIKTGAECVESYLKPVGKAVGNVGRKTGVEGGVRWIFGMRSRKQHSTTDIETSERGNNKRRKADRNDRGQTGLGASPRDADADNEDRRMSVSTVDTLPAYDDHRSPVYSETAEDNTTSDPGSDASGQPWGQRFVVTTSGLGVAMKKESLRSLKYCLNVVGDTTGYLGGIIVKLKAVIDEYDRASQTDGADHTMEDGRNPAPHTADDRSRLILRMDELRDELFGVLHRTVQTVSKYAGSALPENAKNLVHRQLMSLPGLYQMHYVRESEGRPENAGPEAWTRDSAHLALLFAKESLQLMNQVGDVLNRTLVSAEEWCETLYRRKNEQSQSPLSETESPPATPVVAVDRDIGMSG
ncbi:clock-controlled protein 8 [Chaetomidium leptoderma]|uniref:Clock-controlled protein 8 n=1 Tax=Chaetomidium leptoderma TaxID=669021 RepID=A0AAN6ZRE9_9PEZI|nr:clock-controlled protein 8 [Chaetomidium leptoderma]